MLCHYQAFCYVDLCVCVCVLSKKTKWLIPNTFSHLAPIVIHYINVF